MILVPSRQPQSSGNKDWRVQQWYIICKKIRVMNSFNFKIKSLWEQLEIKNRRA